MQMISENLVTYDGESVSFMGLPFSTRMTVAKLEDGTLWVHSPIRLTETLKAQVDAVGEVRYLIAPNHLHHLFLQEWQQAYPNAISYGTKEVINKREGLHFGGELVSGGDYPWKGELESLLFTGSPLMEECVFFHHPSRTLIVTDLIENFPPSDFTRLQRFAAKLTGILAPNGKMPIDWRMSFLFHRKEARAHAQRIMAWQPQRIIMAHGECVDTGAMVFLTRSFGWLNMADE
ncbi:hypothetical protein ABT56_14165 [Photobacterium aquae]|uniref:Methanol oxidase, glmU n=1 Tax=Photobacterium aquae TaxID=1195763 RepID=A0A0J1GYC9_9GAMM|nr:DUF4336 domain-containing protein [Photobacterium aquae]KLV04671.1 hypothetical protein ABT56_14165 [Photobacterium aquae]